MGMNCGYPMGLVACQAGMHFLESNHSKQREDIKALSNINAEVKICTDLMGKISDPNFASDEYMQRCVSFIHKSDRQIFGSDVTLDAHHIPAASEDSFDLKEGIGASVNRLLDENEAGSAQVRPLSESRIEQIREGLEHRVNTLRGSYEKHQMYVQAAYQNQTHVIEAVRSMSKSNSDLMEALVRAQRSH